MVETANTIWADGPASAPAQPDKAKIRAWGTWLESFVSAIGANSGSVYGTRADLFADLAHGPNSMAWVVNDPTTGYNGIYQKVGASGTGSWSRVADLPYSFIPASDVGAGTPNAIIATSPLPISSSALVILDVFEANTASPVTVSFNGGPALTMKTNTGSDVSPGGLFAGMQLLGVIMDTTFRLVNDQVSTAIVAAAQAAADEAEASAQAAEAAAGSVQPVGPQIHAAVVKAALSDGDELGGTDSAASWGLIKFTLANLISSIFKTTRTIPNAQFAASSFKMFNAAGTPRALAFDISAFTADRKITVPDGDITLGGSGSLNISVFTSSGTYTKPVGLKKAAVIVVGGCGGASTSAAAGPGGTSSFGTHCQATGGIGGAAIGGATAVSVAGGVGSGGLINLPGQPGPNAGTGASGIAIGGTAAFGLGQGARVTAAAGAGSSGAGGGGSFAFLDAADISATETVTVGAAGTNSGANTSAASAGLVLVWEFF